MQLLTVLAIAFSLLLCIFVLQNATPVDIKFLLWQFRGISLALVIFGSVALGAFTMFLIGLGSQLKRSLRLRELANKNKHMAQEVKKLKDIPGPTDNSSYGLKSDQSKKGL
ncbi:MAG TPA: LapA family protein [Clostridia bacterium]|nr:LapA family protein [Clostridia bacterium]